MRTHAGGIKSLLLKKALVPEIPSRLGPCERCSEKGEVRYFVAAKLPRFMFLCDGDYSRIRDRLEKALQEILQEENPP